MMIIYKGDDTGGAFGKSVTLDIKTDKDISSAKVYFEFCGVRREFLGVADGDTISIHFSHNETARFPVGTHKAIVWLVDSAGKIRTIDNAIPIRVTSNLAECYGGDDSTAVEIKRAVSWERVVGAPNFVKSIDGLAADENGNVAVGLQPIAKKPLDLSGIEPLADTTTGKVQREMFNKLLAALKAVVSCASFALCGFSFGADNYSQSAKLDDLAGVNTVVTNANISAAISDAVSVNGVIGSKFSVDETLANLASHQYITNYFGTTYPDGSLTKYGFGGCHTSSVERITSDGTQRYRAVGIYQNGKLEHIAVLGKWTQYKTEWIIDQWSRDGKLEVSSGTHYGSTIAFAGSCDKYEMRAYYWSWTDKPFFRNGVSWIYCRIRDNGSQNQLDLSVGFPWYIIDSVGIDDIDLKKSVTKSYIEGLGIRSGHTDTQVTNIVKGVVTKPYVEALGIEAGLSAVAVTNVANAVTTEKLASYVVPADQMRAAAGAALNSIYDDELRVTWKALMKNGSLYYTAVTNVNTTIIGE